MDEQVWDAFEAIMEAREWDERRTVDLLEANWAVFREEGKVAPKKAPKTRGGKKHKKKQASKEDGQDRVDGPEREARGVKAGE